MRVMQTLGRHGGSQEGVFQYKRTADGVIIDTSISKTTAKDTSFTFTHQEWELILKAIASQDKTTFTLSGELYKIIEKAVPKPSGKFTWGDSIRSYVCAVLEHEGTIDIYHGTIGKQAQPVAIHLRSDHKNS